MHPGTVCILLDNGSIPFYMETCQHAESATQGKVATVAHSEQLLPYVGNCVSGCEKLFSKPLPAPLQLAEF
jgi:hypothetical protein